MNEKYCVKCGAQLSLDAKFCFKCGTSVSQPVVSDNVQWEYCEVKQDNRGGCLALGIGDVAWFYVDALGPKGTYIAGRSPALNAYKVSYYGPTSDLPNASDLRAFQTLHGEFVKTLLQDGWEPTPERGENWWNLRFKRRVKIAGTS